MLVILNERIAKSPSQEVGGVICSISTTENNFIKSINYLPCIKVEIYCKWQYDDNLGSESIWMNGTSVIQLYLTCTTLTSQQEMCWQPIRECR